MTLIQKITKMKCDKCASEFIIPEEIPEEMKLVSMTFDKGFPAYRNELKDLCVTCSEQFLKWWSEGKVVDYDLKSRITRMKLSDAVPDRDEVPEP